MTVGESSKRRYLLSSVLSSSPAKIWGSKVSRNVALTAFITITVVQAVVLSMGGVDRYRQERLASLREQAATGVAAILNNVYKDTDHSPFQENHIERLMRAAPITGVAVYSYTMDLIKAYGAKTKLVPRIDEISHPIYDKASDRYDFLLKSSDIQSTYTVAVTMDASSVRTDVESYVMESIVIMIIMSLLVTNVLMIALGQWLLEPIIFMRTSLVAAFKNPECPDITPSPFGVKDEIGAALELVLKLIQSNAENLNHIKSTAEDRIHKLAYYDSMTGLPNRIFFLQKLAENAKIQHDDSVRRFAVVTMDLDHFKDINDSMGHNVGDAILRAVGKRLRSSLPESATVSRAGEDEFALMMPLISDTVTARDVAERVIGIIRSEPFKVFNEEFQVRASVGVSTFPDDSTDPDQVLKNADIALNRAKEEGRDTFKEYTQDFDRAVQERFQMLRDLRDALEHDHLQLFYQPQLDLKTGRVIGAEALLRWWKPDNSKAGGSFISPAVFIPVAEQSGLIVPIGNWVLRKACETSARLRNDHGIDIRMAVNVSGNQFLQNDICAIVERTLHETGVEPHRLELEVTESVFMDDITTTVQILNNLHMLGVELAIDDFGTGYSSLSYLSHFPIDRLKIDQSFVRNALNDKENASIARTIINLGHSLDLKVIAEGVETIKHENFLKMHGCDEVQGYRYCKPVPEEKLLEFIKSYSGNLSSFPE